MIFQAKRPNTWKEDLHTITQILGQIVNNHVITKEKVDEARSIMQRSLSTGQNSHNSNTSANATRKKRTSHNTIHEK